MGSKQMPQHLTRHGGRRRRSYLYAALVGMALLALCAPGLLQPAAHAAAAFTVNSLGDTNDAAPSDGACADSSGACTLRAAIQEANSLAGDDTINFSVTGNIDLQADQLGITG